MSRRREGVAAHVSQHSRSRWPAEQAFFQPPRASQARSARRYALVWAGRRKSSARWGVFLDKADLCWVWAKPYGEYVPAGAALSHTPKQPASLHTSASPRATTLKRSNNIIHTRSSNQRAPVFRCRQRPHDSRIPVACLPVPLSSLRSAPGTARPRYSSPWLPTTTTAPSTTAGGRTPLYLPCLKPRPRLCHRRTRPGRTSTPRTWATMATRILLLTPTPPPTPITPATRP